MSYDTCTTYSKIPVAMPPQELEVKIQEMLQPEIASIIQYLNTHKDDKLSRFSASLLDGCLCFLEDDELDDETPARIKNNLSRYFKVNTGSTPNTSVIDLWAWTESDSASYTETTDTLEEFFLPLLDGDYFIGGYVHENSKSGGSGGAYVISKSGELVRIDDLAKHFFADQT